MKKILGIVGVGLMLLLLSWMPVTIADHDSNELTTKLYAIGLIRINSREYEIHGFVFAGLNGGQLLTFQRIQIEYDGTPIRVTNPAPFLFIIEYTPV